MIRLATVLALIVTLIATAANAQLHNAPKKQRQFVCVEKSDAYKLALADMAGGRALADLVQKLSTESRCAFLPAAYLFTLDPYLDSDGKPSRVVEAESYGERVFGILGSIPDGVWLISHH